MSSVNSNNWFDFLGPFFKSKGRENKIGKLKEYVKYMIMFEIQLGRGELDLAMLSIL